MSGKGPCRFPITAEQEAIEQEVLLEGISEKLKEAAVSLYKT